MPVAANISVREKKSGQLIFEYFCTYGPEGEEFLTHFVGIIIIYHYYYYCYYYYYYYYFYC